MGLKLAFYNTTEKTIKEIIKKGDFTEYDEIDPAAHMLTNYFGIHADHKFFDEAVQELYNVGILARQDFWLEQALITAVNNAQWHSSYTQYHNPAHNELLHDKGFVTITDQAELTPPEAVDLQIPSDDSWDGVELIDEIRSRLKEAHDTKRVE